MDNFYFIDLKPTIDRRETESVKDAIFKRAREKSSQIAEEKSENYTAQIQSDVMDVARESLRPSPQNPFSQFLENIGTQNVVPKEEKLPDKDFSKQENVRTVKRNVESASESTLVNSVKDETMTEARNQFRQGTNLMATLNFLNTQAAINMAYNAHSKIKVS